MPADAQPKVESQAEADAKIVDLPSDGPSVDVEPSMTILALYSVVTPS